LAGILIALAGVYMAGGDELACVSAPAGSAPGAGPSAGHTRVARCTFRTRRWLGRSVVSDSTYSGVTRTETLMVPQRDEDADDQWFVRLFARDEEVGRIFATREQVQQAHGRLRAWFGAGLDGPIRFEWSSWPFAFGAMGFSVVWLSLLATVSRVDRQMGL
jgi:hypothetical protein